MYLASTEASFLTVSETNTLATNFQISVPTISLSPDNAAAIAGGIAIGEGLSLLLSKGLSISDESELEASKTDFINSIETLK